VDEWKEVWMWDGTDFRAGCGAGPGSRIQAVC